MPIFEYQCDACGRRFEQIQKFADPPPADVCTVCGKGPVRKLLSSPAIQFKGEGWYITDYSRKGKSDSSSEMKSEKAEAAEQAAKTEKADKPEKADKAGTPAKSESTDAKPSTPKADAPATPTSTTTTKNS